MSHADLILAIDLGTSGARAGVFDLEGRLVQRAEASYETSRPRPTCVEQDPDNFGGRRAAG